MLIRLAINGNDKFVADDYEMKQHAWDIATYLTMEHFKDYNGTLQGEVSRR
ncbi:hypothetical protein [Sporomusa acidovorans]|uniref:Uncharacterized protein n=1 Tax=Sporomusa acidovorans (strain ATCC 49682 / DSM 3132 / Mol) TaxID=1123286 RepID=A0ABZ3J5S1_SPOA4|nr:hypothetical protein [Sporomusa acidovorans]OZC23540.1 hypothetical protein SPACI_06410 [Sporomusa acidovorans DSM 3132]SDF46944.1 hypothetical protein SAMN04488499_10517 [Sporomusa acidovorans]